MVNGQVGIGGIQHVHGWRSSVIVGVEDDHPPGRTLGQSVDDVVDQIPLGIDDHRAASCRHIVQYKVGDEGRLSGSRRSQNVNVLTGVMDLESNLAAVAHFGPTEHLAGRVDLRWRSHDVCSSPRQARDTTIGGEMGHCGNE